MGCVDFRTDFVRGTELGYILVVELQRTVQVAVQGGRGEKSLRVDPHIEDALHAPHDVGCFFDGYRSCCLWRLGSLQHHAAYGIFPFDQELEHEA